MSIRRARKLLRQLSSEEVRERVHLLEGHLRTLQAIGLGRPVKNAKLALDAIALMMAYSQPKPAQQLDVRQATIQVVDPYSAPTPALPPGPVGLLPPARGEDELARLRRQVDAGMVEAEPEDRTEGP